MTARPVVVFAPFRLDLDAERLWRDANEIKLKPKAIALLAYLATNPRRLISKDELVGAVWADTHISAETLRSTLRAVRDALADDPKAPRFIETVHARGYRFIAKVQATDGLSPADESPVALVGRASALSRLRDSYRAANAGRRQLLFVVAESGLGKTAVVEVFMDELRRETDALCAHGQSVAGYGAAEPFMPLLEALGRLCRGPGGAAVIDVLERQAPTWVAELPGVVDAERLAAIEAGVLRTGRERMLSELAAALDAVSEHRPLVLLLEDVHWSDTATLAALEVLARRTEPSRLLVIATHRPTGADQPALSELRAELRLHGHCDDLPLPLLSLDDTQVYLRGRFPGAGELRDVAELVFARSDGIPLMMSGYADQLVRDGAVVEDEGAWRLAPAEIELAVPDGVRQLIEHQIEQLSAEEQHALEIAAVAGVRFHCDAVSDSQPFGSATAAHLTRLARRGAVLKTDGADFVFRHALHQEVLYGRVAEVRRRRLHAAIGERLEELHGERRTLFAAELAMHFERGEDLPRAIHYLAAAADVAMQRSSHAEAALLVRRALSLLDGDVEDFDHRRAEFSLLSKLGNCLTMTKGYVDPEVREVYDRAFELSADIDDDTPELISVLAGLAGFYELRGEHGPASDVTQRQLAVANESGDPYDRVVASLSRAIVCFSIGLYEEASNRLRDCRDGYDPALHGPMVVQATTDPGVQCLGHGSLVFGGLGAIDEASEWGRESVALAEHHSHVPSLVLAHFYAMTFSQFVRSVDGAERHSRLCLELSMEHGFPYYIPAALVVAGWAMAFRGQAAEGAVQAAQGVQLLEENGARLGQPLYQAMLAEAWGQAGDFEAGLAAVASGLRVVSETGEVASESFLHWAYADLIVKRSEAIGSSIAWGEVEDRLGRGLEVARRCGARMQAGGPAVSLARALSEQGRNAEARSVLANALADLPPSSGAPMLTDANAVLAAL